MAAKKTKTQPKKITGQAVIVVESPTKTRTIKGYLGDRFSIVSSMGHVRDLPKKELGVEIDEGFSPKYVDIPEKKDTLRQLKFAVKDAAEVFLATDPDREGEAIAWHVAEALKLKEPRRIEFNEITKSAITRALEHPRTINYHRVNAQQTRRVLDRLVGYKLSPLLWKKVGKGLSAGRVQSVTVRLICEREREIQAFNPEEYWSITARLSPQEEPVVSFLAKLDRVDGEKAKIESEDQTNGILGELEGAEYVVKSVKEQEKRRNPVPPFITSTLQQEAAKKLGFSAKKTMMVAQQLYEGIELGSEGSVGLIIYMRTDATRVAAEAQEASRELVRERYGKDYVPAQAPQYKSKKGAQDAHEAIRPSEVSRSPDGVRDFLSKDQARLYELIWMRFVASQMVPAVMDTMSVDIAAVKEGLANQYTFRATGSNIKFPGFLAVYQEAQDEDKPEDEDLDKQLPSLAADQLLDAQELIPQQHFTQPPPRYTEATLVRTLEENGIGRPSTYAAILSTIVDRGYTELESRRFKPTELGFIVNDKLVQHFADVMDVGFTADLESRLDEIEDGSRDWTEILRDFWGRFSVDLEKASGEMEKVGGEETDEVCPNCGKAMVVRYSRHGYFLGCSGFPECKTTQALEPEGDSAEEFSESSRTRSESAGNPGTQSESSEEEKECPDCGSPMLLRQSRRGKFYGCSTYPKCRGTLPHKPVEGEPAPKKVEPELTDKECPKCGAPMLLRDGKFGKFLGCSTYPKCRGLVNLNEPSEPLGKCPKPDCEGDIVQKRYRKGKRSGVFYGCSKYPDCDFSLWDKPTGETCATCGSLMVEKAAKGEDPTVQCSNKECKGQG